MRPTLYLLPPVEPASKGEVMLKSLGSALFHRVVLAYKSTLLGLALVAADVVISQLQVATLPNWAHVVVGLAASVLALYRGKAVTQAPVSLPPAA